MNRIDLIGRLTKDIELRTNEAGTTKGVFTLAVKRIGAKKGTQQTDFFPCVVWNSQAENMDKYTSKGSLIAIEGELRADIYEDKDKNKKTYTNIRCTRVEYLEPKEQKEQKEQKEEVKDNDPFSEFANEVELTDDDLPF